MADQPPRPPDTEPGPGAAPGPGADPQGEAPPGADPEGDAPPGADPPAPAGPSRPRAGADAAVSARSRSRRTLAVARLAGSVGASAAGHRARRVFASAGRRRQLDAEHQLRTATQVADTLGSMKGALMKLGQLASFLDDALPEPVRQTLATLQQDADPMAPELAAEVVTGELGAGPEERFAVWDPAPIAAASIGQVHRALTHDGRAVAVKVQYPGVEEAMGADLANLSLAGLGLGRLFPGLDAAALVEELRARLLEELDYRHEAANQRRFAAWYRHHPFITVPDVVDELSTRRVLTTDLADGARFDEVCGWDRHERDLAAETVFRFVFRSLYRFHAFNGDPHPGNYLFGPGGRVTFLDFGLVKHLTGREVALLFDVVHASVGGDPEQPAAARAATVRRACEAAGFVVPGAPVADDRIADYMGLFWEAVRHDRPTTITAAWASQVARRYLQRDEFGDVLAHVAMPPAFAVLQRINLGLLAVLGQLQATGNWRRVAEELWPTAGPPSTELGRREARWWAEHHPGR